MKESILPLFLILMLTIEVDGSRSILKRKQAVDRCHGMQEVRRCSGAPSSWHFDLRVEECRQSNEEECGSRGNRFQSKEDCEKICIGSLNISARHFAPGYHQHPQRQQYHVPGLRWPDPCCHNNYHCNGHNCGHNRPNASPLIISAVSYPCPGNHCPPCNIHPCPKPQPCTGPHCPYECDHPCPSPPPTSPPPPPPPPPTTPCPVHHCRHECNPCPYHYPRPTQPIQLPCHHESRNRCCGGCRTGTYRRPCYSHHRCGYDCCNVTRHNCTSSTTVAPSSPPTTREQPIIGIPATSLPTTREQTTIDYDMPDIPENLLPIDESKSDYGFIPYLAKMLHHGVQPREFNRVCSNIRATCRLQCPLGYARDRYGCPICKCFQKRQAAPVDCSLKPSCTMFCEHGFQKGPDGCDICLCSHTSTE